MQPLCRALAVVGAVVLLLVIVAADDPTGAPDTTPPADSLPPGVTRGGAERSLTDDTHPGALEGDSASLDTLNSGAFNLDPLPGDAQSGPAGDVPAQSNESQESVDHDTDSEEALASPGM